MFEQFTEDARSVVIAAGAQVATSRSGKHIGTEHLLIGVAASGHSTALDITSDELTAALERMDHDAMRSTGIEIHLIPSSDARPPLLQHRRFTSGAKQSLRRSAELAVGMGTRHIGADHILFALATASDRDPAVRLMSEAGFDPIEIGNAAKRALSK